MTSAKQHAEKVVREVDLLRKRVGELKGQIEELERAPVPRPEALENLREFVQGEAARYRSTVSIAPLVRPGRRLLGMDLALPVLSRGYAGAGTGDALMTALLCAVAGESVEAMLTVAVDAHLAAHPEGLHTEERGPRVAQLHAELRGLEEREEILIRQAENAGLEIDRRADADPAVVLGLVSEAA